jgi:hypothetical protein
MLRIRPMSCVAAFTVAAACTVTPVVSPADSSGEPSPLRVELSPNPVLATPPARDTARVAGVTGGVAVVGVLNQTAPCFALSASATRTNTRVLVLMTATEAPGTCATFAAGAFEYDVGVQGLASGTYDVDIVHRVVRNDGTVVEATVGGKRVQVK